MTRTPDTQPAARRTARGVHAYGDLAFERREWIAERVGMAAMAAIIAAALGGFLGAGGIWSTARAQVGAFTLNYERFVRRSAMTPLAINLNAATTGPVRIRLARDYVAKMEIESITPAPRESSIAGDDIEFVFDGSSAPGAQQVIRFQLRPQAIGAHHGLIAIADAAPVRFNQFTYP